MAPSRSNYAVLPEPVLMEDRRSWNRGSNSGLWLMGVLSGLALLLTTALLVKTYVLNPHPVAHSHLGDGKVNKFDISQIQQIRPSPENDCYGDPSYWHEENFKYCCETAGTGPGCQSMHHNNDDLDRFDPESDNYQGFRGPGFDAPMFEGSYNPSYQSGSYDPTDSVGTIGSDDGYPPEIVSHEVIDEDGPFQKSDPYADFEQPDPKDFHPKEEFIDCTSPKDDDTIKKLEICCHHGNAGCDILAAKKAAKKAAEEKESEEKRKKKEKEEREKKEKEQKEKEEREKKEKEEKEKEEQEKKEREEKEKKEREEKEKKEREEKEKKLKEEKEEEPKEEKEEKPKEEKEAKPKEEKEEKPKEEKEEKPKEEKEEKPKEEKEEKPKEEKEEKPKEEEEKPKEEKEEKPKEDNEENPKEEKEEKPKEEKETKDTPKPATPEQPKKPAEEKNEESSKDKTEKPKAKASETKLKVKKAEEHVAWYDKQQQVVWPTFNRLKLKCSVHLS